MEERLWMVKSPATIQSLLSQEKYGLNNTNNIFTQDFIIIIILQKGHA